MQGKKGKRRGRGRSFILLLRRGRREEGTKEQLLCCFWLQGLAGKVLLCVEFFLFSPFSGEGGGGAKTR
jgi:hypothetical protein